MNSSEFRLNIISALNKQLSRKQIKSDLKALDDSLYVKVIAKLSTALSKRQIKSDLKQLNQLNVQVGADLKVNGTQKKKIQSQIKQLQTNIGDLQLGIGIKNSGLDIKRAVSKAGTSAQKQAGRIPIAFNIDVNKEKAINDILYIGKKYSKLFSNVSASQKYSNLLEAAYSISDPSQLKDVRTQIGAFTSELKASGLAAESTGSKWKKLIDRSKDLFSAASVVATVFSQVKQAMLKT